MPTTPSSSRPNDPPKQPATRRREVTNLRRRLRRLAAGTIAGALALSTAPLMGVGSVADALPPVTPHTGSGAFRLRAYSDNPISHPHAIAHVNTTGGAPPVYSTGHLSPN